MMKATHLFLINLAFFCVTIHLEFTDATGLASFDLETNWNTIRCANQNPIVDEKTIILTATGLVWPRDLFCLALRKNLKVSGEYEMSSQLLNVAGNQSIGFSFKVIATLTGCVFICKKGKLIQKKIKSYNPYYLQALLIDEVV